MNRKIVIVGLGPGDPDQLTLGAMRVFEQAKTVYLRTSKHPTVPFLPKNPRLENFDDIYDRANTFGEVYDTIVARLIEMAGESGEGPVVYAVPGHPLVGESSVLRLLAATKKAGIETEIVHGLSYFEPVFGTLGVDPLAIGMAILDATELAEQPENSLPRQYGLELPVTRPLLIGQVYNQRLASGIKLALMEAYPDDHPVTLLRGAGIPGEEGRLDIPLYELDRHPEWTDHLTSAYLPALPVMDAFGTFANAHYVVSRLRAPGGCDWDRDQTHASLKRHLLEEAYEVIHALDEDPDALAEELGDLLLQILLHAQIAAEEGEWSIADVFSEMSEKLIRRHPHIFGPEAGKMEKPNWEELKRSEKESKGDESSVLAGVPRDMPALQQAQALQRKAGGLGFKWRAFEEVMDKLVEEVQEVKEITNQDELVEEIGDVLMVLASAAQAVKVDAEEALRLSNSKFRRRFEQWEIVVKERGLDPHAMDLAGLQEVWNEAKKRVKQARDNETTFKETTWENSQEDEASY